MKVLVISRVIASRTAAISLIGVAIMAGTPAFAAGRGFAFRGANTGNATLNVAATRQAGNATFNLMATRQVNGANRTLNVQATRQVNANGTSTVNVTATRQVNGATTTTTTLTR